MSPQRFALIDPAAGISGDMLLGALIDLGAPADWLRGLPGRLGLPEVEVDIRPVDRCGLRATKVTVRSGEEVEEPGDVPAEALAAVTHEHGHHHHGPGAHAHEHFHHGHRHVAELLDRIGRAPLSPWVKERAGAAFRLLAEAEGRVHGIPADRVALHEVGAWDALVDIVGSIEGFEQLGMTRVHTRPLPLGNGWVRAAHGVLPVPAPATALLVEGLAVGQDGPVQGEATTPTGAVLLRVLATPGLPSTWRARAVGMGAGGRDPGHYPNVLKVFLAESVPARGTTGELVVVASDIDDLSPEYLEPLREALVAAGAVDVQSWATQMKKGRIGFRVEALAPTGLIHDLADAFFRHSTTAGVRWWRVERDVLPRDEWHLEGSAGRVGIKTVHAPGGPRVKPEYDDVVAEARRTGQPAHEVSRRLQEEALRRVRAAGGTARGGDNAHEKE